MARRLLAAVICSLALSGCVERNPPRPPPDHAELARGGVWVAYNLGCDRGCNQIRRGDRILAVDGVPVTSGAELDAVDLARGEPVRLRLARHGSAEEVEVTIVARPNDRLPPIAALPPLLTVGTAALDRAPVWARSSYFGRAIPPLRLGSEAGQVTGRHLYGRAALLLIWRVPRRRQIEQRTESLRVLPEVYAQLQSFADRLQVAGVYPCLVLDDPGEPGRLDPGEPGLFERTRRAAKPGASGHVPIFGLVTGPWSDPTAGVELAELVRDKSTSEVIILDHRGIVRFHALGLPAGPHDTLAAAIDFALHALPDVPATQDSARRYSTSDGAIRVH